MTKDIETDAGALRERPVAPDDRKGTLEAELEALVSGGWQSEADPASGEVSEDESDILNGVYLGERPEFRDGQIAVYRRVVSARTKEFPLRGFDPSAGADKEAAALSLARLYIGINTDLRASQSAIDVALKAVRRGRTEPFPPSRSPQQCVAEQTSAVRPVQAIEAAILRRCQVLLGTSGSGKTTFVNFLANALATQDEKRLAGWPASERHFCRSFSACGNLPPGSLRSALVKSPTFPLFGVSFCRTCVSATSASLPST